MDQEVDELELLIGTVKAVIYKNEENGYTVLRLIDEDGREVTAVGCMPLAAPGEDMVLSGCWTAHNVHGRQFQVEQAQRSLPSSEAAIYDFLAGGAIKGIGPATASLIVNRFGAETLQILESSPEKLSSIRGISTAKAQLICQSFREQADMRRVMDFFCGYALRPILALRAYRFYGAKAVSFLTEDPYLLASDHIGGSFAEADRMASELGIDSFHPRRVQAAILFELKYNLSLGHCFIPQAKLEEATAKLIHVEPALVRENITELSGDGRLIFEHVAGCDACYLPQIYLAEIRCAQTLSRMAKLRFNDRVDLLSLIRRLEQQTGLSYAPQQLDCLRKALENQLLLITGGPGTGKTTSVRAILAMFDALGLKTLLAAPTGRAAKRLTELGGQEAATVHRLLGARFGEDGETVVFTKNAQDPLDCHVLIVDECSMLDITLMDALLQALPPSARLVMVGDADQLPSVGPGHVFSAMLRSKVIPTVSLTEIFRQKADSRIVRNAHKIIRGEHPDFSENAGDFFRLKRFQASSAIETVLELCAVRLPEKMHIPAEDIQVLSPTRRGELGTVNLNRCLQSVLNPPAPDKREKSFGESIFREGDKIMQVKNNYDLLWNSADGKTAGVGIYNGDLGRLVSIDPEAETLTLDFDGRIAVCGFESLLELEHAWAITVHKSQGSEYRAVILALSPSSKLLLTRDVFYTAVTRAKELLVLVGEDTTAYRMIDNFHTSKRYNALRVRLEALTGAVPS